MAAFSCYDKRFRMRRDESSMCDLVSGLVTGQGRFGRQQNFTNWVGRHAGTTNNQNIQLVAKLCWTVEVLLPDE